MTRIRILSPDLVNQIAAGEVIERPASVVKELVENAIDAGSGTVSVEMQGDGCELIRVSDDGSGMTGDELDTAILRHATSKIAHVDDLCAIRTLGFRGEALPSILSVSRTEIATRPGDSEHGLSLLIEGGTVVRRASRGLPQGTTIEVTDLFFNTPARRKFLKTASTEQRNVIDIVARYGLAYPGIRFSLTVNGRTVLNLPGGSTLEDRAMAVLGARLSDPLVPFRRERPGLTVSGLLALPKEARQNRTGIHAFVNRRAVKDAMLGAAVIEGYSGLLMRGRYPVAVLFVDIDPAEVDVNVHPSKAEVRFRYSSAVFGLVVSSIRDTLAQGTPREAGNPEAVARSADGWRGSTNQGSRGLEVREEPSASYGPRAMARMQPGTLFEDGPPHQPEQFSYGGLSVIGVFHATYVLLQDHDSLYIMDQHAAHERITYERLRRMHARGDQAVQELLTPMVLDLSPREHAAFEPAADAMEQLGIVCEPFGETSIAVRSVPQPLADKDIREAVLGLLHAIIEGEVRAGTTGTRLDEMLSAIACHSSVRAGKALTRQEAQHLLDELVTEGSPLTCPHGRPLFRKIPLPEVERWLGRRV
ncbi:MAG TPA: DNA mismatch repair endonuclease MutL [Deltaproteobacteria bacterium]|nr:MAG: DNA mismatch repair protein MutL [Deltaproteobacteria bacterium ADurb.Bin072]HNQ86734.1 DNA mismatch repair endonuclease MutL [Deltaproteobacteria bacterium]HNS90873.1 DNA mismatch repair endonuclease MutL [Deltaproteobacteria bacterium]HOA45582.1 DNA mismatch repair endonuclease MutL [Deltaproteobacteria bacterium]HOG85338.1 DNA mismatch repair endonuclease MutL [Deltaproteobacteria bacterium]